MNILNMTVQQLIDNGTFTRNQVDDLISRAARASARNARLVRRSLVKTTVSEKIMSILTEPGATVKHRGVWEAVGRSEFTRDEVLNALRSLRNDGVLQNIRTSGNNFQVFWALVDQPEAPSFETLEEIESEES